MSWHLRKKTGAVMRSIDRGIMSANTVVDFLFLRLLPTIVELIVLCVIWSLEVRTPGALPWNSAHHLADVEFLRSLRLGWLLWCSSSASFSILR